ncbi:MAG: hypothetical protein AAGC79_02550 [Pseudomonadota bacterium]
MTKPPLLIAMPTCGQIATPTVKSLITLTQALGERGHPFAFATYEFSDIVFSRNQLMSRFYSDERYQMLLFIDSDMEFAPEAFFRLLAFGEPVTAAAYPQKHPEWARLRALIEAEAERPPDERMPLEDLVARAWIYNHQIGGYDGQPWSPSRRGGFITVPSAGTGFMLIHRSVPERMVATGAAPRRRRHEVHQIGDLRYHDFFSHRVSADDGFIFGEDQSFCHRWTEACDGEIWLDCESVITHWGQKSFPGRYAARVDEDFPET